MEAQERGSVGGGPRHLPVCPLIPESCCASDAPLRFDYTQRVLYSEEGNGALSPALRVCIPWLCVHKWTHTHTPAC